MTTSIQTFQDQVEILLGPGDSRTELSNLDIQAMIRAAVERYSSDRPDIITEDEAGDGGKYYLVSALVSWIEGFSRIVSIQYPAEAVTENINPVHLESEDWQDDYWVGPLRYLFLPNHNPTAAETMRIMYTAPYAWSSGTAETETPGQDFHAICYLAAGLCCHAISTKFSRTTDSTIGADSVGHPTRAGQFAKRAKEYIDLYEEHMGLGGDDGKPPFQQAAGTYVDMDTAPTWMPGREFLFHGRLTR
jgi:hypothetical protein